MEEWENKVNGWSCRAKCQKHSGIQVSEVCKAAKSVKRAVKQGCPAERSVDSSVAACRVRLVMLFSLRYEREGRAQTSDLLQRMQETGVARQQLGLVRTLLLNCGQEKRVGDLFSDMTFSSRFATLAKQNLKVCITAKACVALLCDNEC